MTTWIITTGNSDVQINTDDNWGDLYQEIEYQYPIEDCNEFSSLDDFKIKDGEPFQPPARVTGLVYSNHEENYDDLDFPLLDVYCQYFEANPKEKPDKITILLTDQSKIFTEDIQYRDCPFWQDTLSLEPLLKWYFQNKINIEPTFLYLQPESGQGIDHWNDMLGLVRTTLNSLDIPPQETVYVSHQAGTPAISSAVQFITISRFEIVKFLNSNQSYDEGEKQANYDLIDSSNYWRGLQIQKAKRLIKEGIPGAALELLEGLDISQEIIDKLKYFVDLFNIKATVDNKQKEFAPENAIERVRQALDLIEIFFKQKNYVPGIALLAAAQETFVKAAIIYRLEQLANQGKNIKISDFIDWNNAGLCLIYKNSLDDLFPKLNLSISSKIKGTKINNTKSLELLNDLGTFTTWKNLDWSFQYKREREDDLRNQLLHNLRGVEEQDVIRYLLGNPKENESEDEQQKSESEQQEDVTEVYLKEVKKPFVKALYDLGLWSDQSSDNNLEKKLDKLANSLG